MTALTLTTAPHIQNMICLHSSTQLTYGNTRLRQLLQYDADFFLKEINLYFSKETFVVVSLEVSQMSTHNICFC